MPEMPEAVADYVAKPRALDYTPQLPAEIVSRLPAIRAALEAPKPTRAWIIGELARMAIHTWQPDRPMEQQRTLANDYADELAGCPQYALEEAFRECRRTCRFFPRLPEILEAVAKADRKRVTAVVGIGMLEAKARFDGPARAPSTPLTAEQQSQVDQILAEARAKSTRAPERRGRA